MTISVRPLRDDDWQSWYELWAGYLSFYETSLSNDITDQCWSGLMTPGKGHDGLVAVNDAGQLIGLAHFLFHPSTWTKTSYCYLEDLYVAPTARGLGAGRALINGVEGAARAKGSTRLYLATQEFNATARSIYDKTMSLAPFVQYRKTLD